jgi:alkaline phosphatase
MASSKPLLANDSPPSVNALERTASEEDALLGNRPQRASHSRSNPGKWREIGLFAWAVAATAAVIILGVLAQHRRETERNNDEFFSNPSGKRNLIFMVSDGMGPASLSLTRSFRQYEGDLEIDDILHLDQHLIGQSRTRSSSSLVTDSAAGATAFSCGRKSYNGAISMLPDHTPCGTVLEAAKRAGYLTGLVVTTDITDATPACFASHVNMRLEGDSIAAQEIGEHPLGRVVDLMLGGGRCHFLPNETEGGCRQDGRDITKLAQEKYGWNYVNNRAGFDSLDYGKKAKLPLLGLFAPTDIPFELDRAKMNDIYPSLDEMARTAITALSEATKDSDKGFFLMIEGSRIDHAGHSNDPAAQVREVLGYDKAFASVLKFIEDADVPTVVVGTSDHETGGLSVSRRECLADICYFGQC